MVGAGVRYDRLFARLCTIHGVVRSKVEKAKGRTGILLRLQDNMQTAHGRLTCRSISVSRSPTLSVAEFDLRFVSGACNNLSTVCKSQHTPSASSTCTTRVPTAKCCSTKGSDTFYAVTSETRTHNSALVTGLGFWEIGGRRFDPRRASITYLVFFCVVSFPKKLCCVETPPRLQNANRRMSATRLGMIGHSESGAKRAFDRKMRSAIPNPVARAVGNWPDHSIAHRGCGGIGKKYSRTIFGMTNRSTPLFCCISGQIGSPIP